MFADWCAGSDHELRLRRDQSTRSLPWIIGLTAYLAVTGVIGLILTGDAIGNWDRTIGRTLTLQVPAETSAARIESTLALLRQTRGIKAVRVLDQNETARLLQPWLGSNVPIELLPVPRLVDIEIDPDTAVDTATLQQQLASVVPEAKLDDERGSLISLHRFARRIQAALAALVVAAGTIVAAVIVLGANASFAANRAVIELLHLLGASDAYVVNRYQMHALWLGVFGGLGAAVFAALTLLVIASTVTALGWTGSPPITISDWRLWLVIAAAIPAAALVAAVGTRVAVARRLAALP